jgi:hypothetical protein
VQGKYCRCVQHRLPTKHVLPVVVHSVLEAMRYLFQCLVLGSNKCLCCLTNTAVQCMGDSCRVVWDVSLVCRAALLSSSLGIYVSHRLRYLSTQSVDLGAATNATARCRVCSVAAATGGCPQTGWTSVVRPCGVDGNQVLLSVFLGSSIRRDLGMLVWQ